MTPAKIAERIRQVISDSGLSQTEFAARAGLDGSKMSKSLKGTRRFTSLELAQIADLGGVTVDWLLGHETEVPILAARATTEALSSTDNALAWARKFSQLRADLDFLGYGQEASLFSHDLHGSALVRGTELARRAVAQARAVNLNPGGHRDLAGLIEQVFGIDVAVVSMPDGFDGLAWRDEHSRLILVGTSEVPARQRFTIAHELGHLLAGDDQRLHVDADLSDADHKKQPTEQQANAFAAAFLMPEDTVRELVGTSASTRRLSEGAFARLAVELSVSPVTLAWRLQNLRIIAARHRESLMHMSAARAALLADTTGDYAEWIEQASRRRVPSGLIRRTYQAYIDGKATLRPLANLIGVDTDVLREALNARAEGSPLAS